MARDAPESSLVEGGGTRKAPCARISSSPGVRRNTTPVPFLRQGCAQRRIPTLRRRGTLVHEEPLRHSVATLGPSTRPRRSLPTRSHSARSHIKPSQKLPQTALKCTCYAAKCEPAPQRALKCIFSKRVRALKSSFERFRKRFFEHFYAKCCIYLLKIEKQRYISKRFVAVNHHQHNSCRFPRKMQRRLTKRSKTATGTLITTAARKTAATLIATVGVAGGRGKALVMLQGTWERLWGYRGYRGSRTKLARKTTIATFVIKVAIVSSKVRAQDDASVPIGTTLRPARRLAAQTD